MNSAIQFFLSSVLISGSAVAAEVATVDFKSPPVWKREVVSFGSPTPAPFKEWLKAAPVEAKAMLLFPTYQEPSKEEEENGMLIKKVEPQTIFISRSTFMVNKPLSSINLKNLISLTTVQSLDKSFNHIQISANQLIKETDGRPHNSPKASGEWCSNPNSVCIQSQWDYPVAVSGPYKIMTLGKSEKGMFQRTQSELAIVEGGDLGKYSALMGAPVEAAIEQSIFYVNRVVRWGKNAILFQKGPNNTTNVTIYSVVGISTDYYKKSTVIGKTLGEYIVNGLKNQTCEAAGPMAGLIRLSGCAASAFQEILKN